jgi:hypothetical protein
MGSTFFNLHYHLIFSSKDNDLSLSPNGSHFVLVTSGTPSGCDHN